MTSAERGKRIKEARLAKKMTQSDVVGNFITRNMLSQIESGIATPSVKTLEYLAEVLEIPIAGLIPGDDDQRLPASSAVNSYSEAKACYHTGEYETAAGILRGLEETGEFRDESEALLALSYLGLAKKTSANAAVAGGDNAKALEYAKLSADYSERGLYANPSVKAEAAALINRLAKELSDYYAGMISG